MSEEQESEPAQAEENPVEETPAPTPEPAAASAAAAERDTSERLMKKLNLVAGESIDSESVYRPAPLSFTSRYILAFGVLLIHLLFWWFDKFSADSEAAAIVEILSGFFGFGVTSFVFAMLLLIWLNRFLNVSTSGTVYTLTLLLITLAPFLYFLDSLLAGDESALPGLLSFLEIDAYETAMLPGGWSPLIFGIAWFALLIFIVEYNRRTYTYGVSNKAIIMKRDFFFTRNQRRILYDNISDINLEQGVFGTLFRFGNVVPVTESGFGLDVDSGGAAEAAVAVAAVDGAAGEDKKTNPILKFVKFFIVLAMLQRKKKGLTRDPDHCLFGVRKPQAVYDKIAQYQLEHDPAQKMQELKETMQKMTEQ